MRWGIPALLPTPTSPSQRSALGPSLSPLKGGEGFPTLNRPGAFELGAVHQAAGRGVEGVAAVHRAAIVPPHQIAGLPLLGPGEFFWVVCAHSSSSSSSLSATGSPTT